MSNMISTKNSLQILLLKNTFQASKRNIGCLCKSALSNLRRENYCSISTSSTISKQCENYQDLNRQTLKLTSFPKLVTPNIKLYIRNFYECFLIKNHYDASFSISGFLVGAEQAIVNVSSLISKGNFEEIKLKGFLDSEAVLECMKNYDNLTHREKQDLKIEKEHISNIFLYQIREGFTVEGFGGEDKLPLIRGASIIPDIGRRLPAGKGSLGKRIVEVTVVVQYKASTNRVDIEHIDTSKNANQIIANYRFIKNYSSGEDSNWMIDKLNHFYMSELHT